MTEAQYEQVRTARNEERARREEARYEWAERRAKRADQSEEERRAKASAYMLARYHADPLNWSTAKKRRRLFERDAWQCRTCGKTVREDVPAHHKDRAVAGHIVAKARGGEWTDENMATLCYPCNKADAVQRIPIQTHAF